MPVSPLTGSNGQSARTERRESDCRAAMHDDTSSEGSSGQTEHINGMEVDAEGAGRGPAKGVRFDKGVTVHEEP